MNPLLSDYAPSQIVGADGTVLNAPTRLLSDEDARLLRTYKKFLLHFGLKEAMYCNSCYESNREHGMEAFVTDQRILFRCRCRSLFYEGPTL
jgi:ligand-binding sensor protein